MMSGEGLPCIEEGGVDAAVENVFSVRQAGQEGVGFFVQLSQRVFRRGAARDDGKQQDFRPRAARADFRGVGTPPAPTP